MQKLNCFERFESNLPNLVDLKALILVGLNEVKETLAERLHD